MPRVPSEQADIQLELGTAWHFAGSALDAIEAFKAAAEIARGLGDAELLSRAAIGLEDACWRPGIADQEVQELLEEATSALGEQESTLRVGLLSALARVLTYRGEHERAAIVRASAIQLARRIGDRRGLADLLMRAYWARGTKPLEEILEMLGEARDLGGELGDLDIEVGARAFRVITWLALGDVEAARRELAGYLEFANRTRQPFQLSAAEHIGSAIALCEGHLDEAEVRAKRSGEWRAS